MKFNCDNCKTKKKIFTFDKIIQRILLEKRLKHKIKTLNIIKSEYSFKTQIQNMFQSNQPRKSLSPERISQTKETRNPEQILTVDKFRSFLMKMKNHSIHMISTMFKQYSKIFNKEFKSFFRTKSNIFTKFQGDLENKVKMKLSSVFTNKNLILGFLDVPEGSFQDTSLSTYFSKQNQRELLSRNFSSIVSMDHKLNSDSLSLILEYSQSFIDDFNNDFDTSKFIF